MSCAGIESGQALGRAAEQGLESRREVGKGARSEVRGSEQHHGRNVMGSAGSAPCTCSTDHRERALRMPHRGVSRLIGPEFADKVGTAGAVIAAEIPHLGLTPFPDVESRGIPSYKSRLGASNPRASRAPQAANAEVRGRVGFTSECHSHGSTLHSGPGRLPAPAAVGPRRAPR